MLPCRQLYCKFYCSMLCMYYER